jgi:hypothetical protein
MDSIRAGMGLALAIFAVKARAPRVAVDTQLVQIVLLAPTALTSPLTTHALLVMPTRLLTVDLHCVPYVSLATMHL